MSHLTQDLTQASRQCGKLAQDVADDVGSVVRSVSSNTRAAACCAKETAGNVVEAVEERVTQARQAARHAFDDGHARVRQFEGGVEDAIRARPIVSILVAAGVGLVVGELLHLSRRQ